MKRACQISLWMLLFLFSHVICREKRNRIIICKFPNLELFCVCLNVGARTIVVACCTFALSNVVFRCGEYLLDLLNDGAKLPR